MPSEEDHILSTVTENCATELDIRINTPHFKGAKEIFTVNDPEMNTDSASSTSTSARSSAGDNSSHGHVQSLVTIRETISRSTTPPATTLISDSILSMGGLSASSSSSSTSSSATSSISLPPTSSEHNNFLNSPNKNTNNSNGNSNNKNNKNKGKNNNNNKNDISMLKSNNSLFNQPQTSSNFNDVFVIEEEEVEEIEKLELKKMGHERRRSSKRAMSSSNDDECLQLRTKISLVGLNNSFEPKKMKHSTMEEEEEEEEGQVNDDEIDPFENQKIYFGNHESLKALPTCKLISNDEFIDFLIKSFHKPLPAVNEMFPWLHGIHKNNYGQINFLSNSLNPSSNSRSRIITFEKPQSLDENNNYLLGGFPETETDSSDDDDDEVKTSNFGQSDDDGLDNLTKLMHTPNVRFLTPIRSSNTNGEVTNTFTNLMTDAIGLIRGSISAEDLLISYASILNLELYLHEMIPKYVFKIYHAETIITDCIITGLIPVFKNVDPEIGINLRNFNIQVNKISSISDFVVYCFNHEDHHFNMNPKDDRFVNNKCKCVNMGRLLHIAQIVYQEEHKEILKKLNKKELLNKKKYNTFIIKDPNIEKLNEYNLISINLLHESTSLKKDNELCSLYDLNVFNNWDANYLYRERLEISKMSTATPIPGNIWIGNITDYECLQIQSNNHCQELKEMNEEEVNKMVKNQAIEPIYCNFSNTIVNLTNDKFNLMDEVDHEYYDKLLITFPKTIWKFYIKCMEGGRIPSLTQLKLIHENYLNCEFINIEFPPSGSISLADMSDQEILSILNICKLCYYLCDNYKFSCLIYCSDGYTESSLLVLCYLMYSENIGLDEAILKLHLQYGRPFFIFKTDYLLLKKLETIMNRFSPLFTNSDETKENFKLEDNVKLIRSLLLLMPKRKSSVGQVGISTGTSFTTSTGNHIVQLRGNQHRGISSSSISPMFNGNLVRSNNPYLNVNKDTNNNMSGCLEDVFGSLPSRILKHLYLGSLSHANSIQLLSKLGIEYIVSVGEVISWYKLFKHTVIKGDGYEIYSYKPRQYHENSGMMMPVKKLVILNDINDDGIGSLFDIIDKTLKFINDEVYMNKSKVLVHCQVGVSRSATICIAEVMRRLNLSVYRAYLYVRVRRLNVIIQPNLRLMYELFKWAERNHVGEFVTWPVLCREINHLNRAYIK